MHATLKSKEGTMLRNLLKPLLYIGIFLVTIPACKTEKEKTKAICGNGILETGEMCDMDQLGEHTCQSQGFSAGTLSCSESCELVTTECVTWECGNGVLDPGETCEEGFRDVSCHVGDVTFGTVTCGEDCHVDASECGIPVLCGNQELDPGEQCDGQELPDDLCQEAGLMSGEVTCDPYCRMDFGGCEAPEKTCGNGVRDPGEPCDQEDLGGRTCEDLNFFGGGTLACQPDCTFDVSGCHLVEEGLTADHGIEDPLCELGLPCEPYYVNRHMPHVCARPNPEMFPNRRYCMPVCDHHEECPLGKVCQEIDGVSVCMEPECDEPLAPCLLASGISGICTPTYEDRNICVPSGLREYGQSCVAHRRGLYAPVLLTFEFDPLTFCRSGTCVPDNNQQIGPGVCRKPLCDASGVLNGTAPDTCPTLTNCVNTSVFGMIAYGLNTPHTGACLPMFNGIEPAVPGTLSCHVLTGNLTVNNLPCPEQTVCRPYTWGGFLPGSPQGTCQPAPVAPLGEGETCSIHDECEPDAFCVMSDPFETEYRSGHDDYPRACRRICDARTPEDNSACAGLPGEAHDWICLSVSRFYSPNNEESFEISNDWFGDTYTITLNLSPLGFCVPNRL